MSVASATFNYRESCQRSHEFLRRCCSKTPVSAYWAGDLLVSSTVKTKQSEQNDMRGGAGDVAVTFEAINDDCGEFIAEAPDIVDVEETEVRDQAEDEETDSGSFKWIVKKQTGRWDEDIYASNDIDCGVLTDGGDIYGSETVLGTVDSVCGTIHRDLFNPSAYFLDNRVTKEDDEDAGLLFIIRNGINAEHEVRWVDGQTTLSAGLDDAENITAQFIAALTANGIEENDILSFGMV